RSARSSSTRVRRTARRSRVWTSASSGNASKSGTKPRRTWSTSSDSLSILRWKRSWCAPALRYPPLQQASRRPWSRALAALRFGEERQETHHGVEPSFPSRPFHVGARLHRVPTLRLEDRRTLVRAESKRSARLVEQRAELSHQHFPYTRRREIEDPS